MIKASNPLSKALLHSVPKKLYLWMQAVHATHQHTGSHRCELKDDHGDYVITLTWDFKGFNATEPQWSTITVDGTRFGPVTIHWDGDVFMEEGTLIDNELFTDINANLSAFCELEELTYACMQDYADQERKKQPLKHDRDDDDLQAPSPAEV